MTLEKTLKQIQKKKFWQDKKILFSAGLSLLLNLATWLIIIFTFKSADQSVILHFSIFQKADLIGPWIKLLNYPLFALVIFIINLFLIFYFYLLRKKKLVWLLISALVLVQIFCLTAVWLIININ